MSRLFAAVTRVSGAGILGMIISVMAYGEPGVQMGAFLGAAFGLICELYPDRDRN